MGPAGWPSMYRSGFLADSMANRKSGPSLMTAVPFVTSAAGSWETSSLAAPAGRQETIAMRNVRWKRTKKAYHKLRRDEPGDLDQVEFSWYDQNRNRL